MKKLLAVCLMALVCWVCAGYAEETRVGDTVIFGQYEQDGNLDNGSEPIAWLVLDVQGGDCPGDAGGYGGGWEPGMAEYGC